MKNNLGKLQVFSITNEDATKKKRIDVEYYQPFFEGVVKKVAGSKYELQKLEDITLLISNGRTPSKDMYDEDNDQAGSVPIIKAGTASGRFVDLEKLEYAKADFSSGKKVQKGDIFVLSAAHQASYVGKNVSLLDVEPEQNTYFVGELICIRANQEKVLPEYLFSFLSSEVGYLLLNREKRGQTSHIYPEDVKTIPLPIPSLTDQRKIVAILSKAYEEKKQKEAEIKTILAKIDSFVLGELGIEMPEGGAEKTFEVWSDEIVGRFDPAFYNPVIRKLIGKIKNRFGDFISDIYRYPTFYGVGYQTSGIPVIKGENIDKIGNIDFSQEFDFIDVETHQKYSRTHIKKGDLIFTVRGTIGKVGFFNGGFEEANINANVVKISVNKISPEFIWIFLNTKVGQILVEHLASGQVQKTITVPDIKNIPIPLPNFKIQEKIVAEVKIIYEKVRTLRQEAESVIVEAQKKVAEMIFV